MNKAAYVAAKHGIIGLTKVHNVIYTEINITVLTKEDVNGFNIIPRLLPWKRLALV